MAREARADLEFGKPATLHPPMTLGLKLLREGEKNDLGVAAREGHACTLTRTCVACATNLGKLFDRLIDRKLTNPGEAC